MFIPDLFEKYRSLYSHFLIDTMHSYKTVPTGAFDEEQNLI